MRRSQQWFFGYLAFVALVTLESGIKHLYERDGWTMGDWLINYHAGFVRRGLMGEVAARAGQWLHVSPSVLVLLMQMICYAAMLYTIVQLIRGTEWSLWKLAMVLSPATLAFQVLGPTGFRKEVIFLGGLGVLTLLLDKPPRDAWIVLYLSLLGVVCVLSHEPLILFAFYWVAALAIGFNSLSKAIKISVIPAICMLAVFVPVVRHPGNDAMVLKICGSLGYPETLPLPEQCAGAIAYLGHDSARARYDVVTQMRDFHFARVYTFAVLMALLPVVMAHMALWRFSSVRRDLYILASATLISIIASIPVFYYGADWGRWIYIHVFSVFILLLFIDHRRQERLAISAPEVHHGRWTIAFLVVFATCWNLPFIGSFGLNFGYVQLAALLFLQH